MSAGWQGGNAVADGADDWGWFIGYFMEGREPSRATNDLEIKWSNHQRGDARSNWSSNRAHSICLLVKGEMFLQFRDGAVTLSIPGDYVLWGPGVEHSWQSKADTTVVTVRWPSVPPPSNF